MKTAALTPNEQKVLQALSSGNACTKSFLTQRTGLRRGALRKVLRSLAARGRARSRDVSLNSRWQLSGFPVRLPGGRS